jgi:HEAT repeat protein
MAAGKITEIIADSLRELREGYHHDPFFRLLEQDDQIIPELIAEFRGEQDCAVREFIVEVIWQHRNPSAIPFLGEALRDEADRVWKQALDGLVTLGSQAALDELRAAMERPFPEHRKMVEFRSWIDEAIEQVETKSA